jgi:enoyl-CoA hydratase
MERCMPENHNILVEREETTAIVRLNRPEVLNALSPELMAALCAGLETLDADSLIRVIILTGDDRAFAAGADLGVMARASSMDMIRADTRSYWQRLRRITKPIIAAVSGYAFGGGCELAMQCDLIVASETALFAQPEIKVGIIPGAGGTQRLAKAIGPYRAMEMILTGIPLKAGDALAHGLVNRVVPVERYLDEARELARSIAAQPELAIRFAREAVRSGVENTLREGLEVERRNFLLLFNTPDQEEGMQAFLEKRPPNFSGK